MRYNRPVHRWSSRMSTMAISFHEIQRWHLVRLFNWMPEVCIKYKRTCSWFSMQTQKNNRNSLTGLFDFCVVSMQNNVKRKSTGFEERIFCFEHVFVTNCTTATPMEISAWNSSEFCKDRRLIETCKRLCRKMKLQTWRVFRELAPASNHRQSRNWGDKKPNKTNFVFQISSRKVRF